MKLISEVARSLGLDPADLEPYGHYKAKLPLSVFRHKPPRGKLVLVSAITPTPAGEGKTTTSIGLVQGLARIGVKSAAALREPSLGPVFGMKGGGAGGGASEVLPMMDINMHFNGDFHAITSAHNLLAAILDNCLHNGSVVTGTGSAARDLEARHGHERSRAARHRDRPGRAHRGLPARNRIRHHRRQRGDGRSLPRRRHPRPQGTAGPNRGGLRIERQAGHRGRRQGGRRDGSAAARRDQAEPGADHGRRAGLPARRTVRKHRPRHQQHHRDQGSARADRHRGDGSRVRIRTRRREILRHQLQVRRLRAGVHGAGRDDPGTEDARRQAAGRRGPSRTSRPLVRGLDNLDKHVENIHKFGQPCVVAINQFAADTAEEIRVLEKHCASIGIKAVAARPFTEGGKGCTRSRRGRARPGGR